MNLRLLAWRCLIVTALLMALIGRPAEVGAADLGPLNQYLTNDVVAVGYLDLTKVNAAAAVDELAKLGIANEAEIARSRAHAAEAQATFDELTKRGARRAFVLLRITDLHTGGPTWLIEVADDGDPAAVVGLFIGWRDALRSAPPTPQNGLVKTLMPRELRFQDRVVIGSPATEVARRDEAQSAAIRPDAAAALEALLATDGGLVVFGDADSRRVVRETFPPLPEPFAAIDGRLVADDVKWAGITITLPPEPAVGAVAEAASAEAALKLQEAANHGLTLLKGIAIAHSAQGDRDAAAALPALALLQPEVDGAKVSMTIGGKAEHAAAFRSVVAPALMASREAAWRSQRMNNFKHIALGMLNYDSANGSFPPVAIRDAAGKPLLSWRVAILPYIEQVGLYQQFHLDEPWDSEHNRALLTQMPATYSDPAQPDLAAAGRTTFLVPVGTGLIFGGDEGTKLRDITDGTSNTILAVEVTPDHAVEWTKPADWELDLSDPLQGVRRERNEPRGNVFTAARCDGSVYVIASTVDPQAFKARLTIAGGESLSDDGF